MNPGESRRLTLWTTKVRFLRESKTFFHMLDICSRIISLTARSKVYFVMINASMTGLIWNRLYKKVLWSDVKKHSNKQNSLHLSVPYPSRVCKYNSLVIMHFQICFQFTCAHDNLQVLFVQFLRLTFITTQFWLHWTNL